MKRRRRKPTPGEELENIMTTILSLALIVLPFYIYSKTGSLVIAVGVFLLAAVILIVAYRWIRALLVKSDDSFKSPRLPKNKKTGNHINSAPSSASVTPISSSQAIRSDEVILKTPISNLTAYEFERLLALYFQDNGYEVEETGGVADGGVDLIIIDKKGYRTAVQAKHWNFGPVGPDVIRETHSARLNTKPSCHMAMVITSNDITPQARSEADARRMDYWAGHVLLEKLSRWPKWQGNVKKKHRSK